ncbi:MAG: RHS repeat protein [Flavobacteriaceae bacterium]|nr:RHS repeat protein [Flavobacteriaceae bacterium]
MKQQLSITYIFFTLISNLCIAQIFNKPLDFNEKYLMNTPNSPQATELVRYGSVPVNLSNGQLNHNIPLYVIQAKNFTWPISLNYNYSGLKVESRPSASGLGWSLINGGVVTREVRGLPDEWSFDGFLGYYTETVQLILNNYEQYGQMNWYTIQDVLAGKRDLEPDKYHVSAGDLNFSFKVKKEASGNYVPVIMSPENYIVNFSFDEISVIDDTGVKYIFNKKEVHTPKNAVYSTEEGIADSYTVSWFLSKIILRDVPNENESYNIINFEYQNHYYSSKSFFAAGEHSTTEIIINGVPVQPEHRYNDGFTTSNIVQPSLKRIEFPSGYIDFDLNATDKYPLYYGLKVFSNHQEEMFESPVNDYQFSYSGNRRLLDFITKNGEHFYSFDYYNKNSIIPFSDDNETIITARDEWGYYNGQTNNEYAVNMPGSIYLANKQPYFDYTVPGALKKITYPSKGYTEIQYEQNTVKMDFSDGVNTTSLPLQHKHRIQLGGNGFYDTAKEKSKTITLNNYAFAKIKITEKAFNLSDMLAASFKNVSSSCSTSQDGCTSFITGDFERQSGDARVYCNNPIPLICPYYNPNYIADYPFDGIAIGPDGFPDEYTNIISTNGLIKIPPGTYELKILSKGNAQVSIDFSFVEIPTENENNINVPIGGIRVAKTIDYDGTENKNLVPDVTIYDYDDENGLSLGEIYHKEYKSVIQDASYLYNNPNNSTDLCVNLANYLLKNVSLYSLNPVNTNSGLPVFYPQVRVYKNPVKFIDGTLSCGDLHQQQFNYSLENDDGSLEYELLYRDRIYGSKMYNLVNGYSLHYFKYPHNFERNYPFTPVGKEKTGALPNVTIYRGQKEFLSTQEYTAKVSLNNYELKELENIENLQLPLGIKVAERIKYQGNCRFVIPDNELGYSYFREMYRENDVSFRPVQSITTYYSTDGLPLQMETQTTTYNDKNYISSIETSASDGDILKTELYYPFNTPNSSNALTDKNVLANPVLTISKRNDEIIGAQELKHMELTNYPVLETIKSAKSDYDDNIFDSLEERVSFLSYDIAGNPTEVVKENGPNTVYLWGYNYSYLIAKIENSNLAEIENILRNYVLSEGGSELNFGNDPYAVLQGLMSTGIQTMSNYLREQLNSAQVTSYTYKSLVGIESITDPRGYTMTYQYDNQNRLQFVLDDNGKVLEKNEYIIRDGQ